jgi:hypothetical protein
VEIRGPIKQTCGCAPRRSQGWWKHASLLPSPSASANRLKEIARFTEEGFYYKGEFIDDAGEVHRLLKEVLGQMKAEQNA